jgi:hypothetical protein
LDFSIQATAAVAGTANGEFNAFPTSLQRRKTGILLRCS